MADTRNLESRILQALAKVKNSSVANAISMDESFISGFSAGSRGLRLSHLEAFFKSIGMRVIECDGEVVQIPKKERDAIVCLAQKAINDMANSVGQE